MLANTLWNPVCILQPGGVRSYKSPGSLIFFFCGAVIFLAKALADLRTNKNKYSTYKKHENTSTWGWQNMGRLFKAKFWTDFYLKKSPLGLPQFWDMSTYSRAKEVKRSQTGWPDMIYSNAPGPRLIFVKRWEGFCRSWPKYPIHVSTMHLSNWSSTSELHSKKGAWTYCDIKRNHMQQSSTVGHVAWIQWFSGGPWNLAWSPSSAPAAPPWNLHRAALWSALHRRMPQWTLDGEVE